MGTRCGEKANSRAGFQEQGKHEGVRPGAREDHENEFGAREDHENEPGA